MAAPVRLGVLAGRGTLPGQVIDAALADGREVFVIAFDGETDPEVAARAPHAWVSLGAVGKALGHLHRAGVEEVVLAGPVKRPSFATLRLDMRGVKLLAKLGSARRGDDRILSLVVRELEGEGFRVVGADDILASLLTPEGPLGRFSPGADDCEDIDLGCRVVLALGALDVGQAAVVQRGAVLGVEAVEGTDALLERCARLRLQEPGGVLVKLKKPKQERRADLPTIGPRTVELVQRAGFRGIALEAGNTLILERRAVTDLADAAEIFVVGIPAAH
jgi:UDP-2,3-diacylglucosamine hydrolase